MENGRSRRGDGAVRSGIPALPTAMRGDPAMAEGRRRDFTRACARGMADEKRRFARVFVRRIVATPAAGEIQMHPFGDPTVLERNGTPAGVLTGVSIDLAAGAG